MSTTTRTFAQNLHNVLRRRGGMRFSTQSSQNNVREQLRALLRETAQPVAVVTSLMPKPISSKSAFHGATLSSFTSIAMDPHPLVTFALRIPSRMATSLDSTHPDSPSHMVINLLSAEQTAVAHKFSRPDLHPEPFNSIPYFLTEDGLPVLEGSLGAISCKLVSKAIPLHDLDFLGKGCWEGITSLKPPVLEEGVSSELFIARVTRVESLILLEGKEDCLRTLPLLYHRRKFTSCHESSQSNSKQ